MRTCLLLLIAAFSAKADSVINVFADVTVPAPPFEPEVSTLLYLDKFDPLLGTLTSAHLRLSGLPVFWDQRIIEGFAPVGSSATFCGANEENRPNRAWRKFWLGSIRNNDNEVHS